MRLVRLSLRLRLRVFVTSLVVGATGCAAVLGLDEKQTGADAGAGADAGTGAGAGAGIGADAGTDAPSSVAHANCTFDDEGFGDPGAEGCWETVALETVLHGASFDGTNGAAFDGKYLYLAPRQGMSVVRFDTQSAVTDEAAWTNFDVKAGLDATPAIAGAVFDGRYVTFVPRTDTTLLLRYDTSAPFDAATSWETFDTTKLDPHATNFAGGTYDGRYVYLSPRFHSLGVRHDALAALDEGWEVFDLGPIVGIVSAGYYGAVYDGHGIVFVPEVNGLGLRYDTRSSFVASSSWSTFDSTEVTKNSIGFTGGAFDGDFVYLAPDDGIVLRVDARASFDSASAWSFFDLSEIPSAASLGLLHGAGFDGRFVFFSPSGSINGTPNRKFVRYDTKGPFDVRSSWRVTEPGAASVGASSTSVYDGRSLYFPPGSGTIFARFAARREAHAVDLPAFHGSFY